MSNMNTGGPAFPTRDNDNGYYGMTLRDYFAAQAINRIGKDTNYEDLAKHVYAIADAMLKAREK